MPFNLSRSRKVAPPLPDEGNIGEGNIDEVDLSKSIKSKSLSKVHDEILHNMNMEFRDGLYEGSKDKPFTIFLYNKEKGIVEPHRQEHDLYIEKGRSYFAKKLYAVQDGKNPKDGSNHINNVKVRAAKSAFSGDPSSGDPFSGGRKSNKRRNNKKRQTRRRKSRRHRK